MWTALWPYIAALIPFLGGALIFYVIMRNMLEGDRNERIAMRRWEAEHGRTTNGTAGDTKAPGGATDTMSDD